MDRRTRRELLAASAVGIGTAVTGCLGRELPGGRSNASEDQRRNSAEGQRSPPGEDPPAVSSEFSDGTVRRARETGHEVRRAVVKLEREVGKGRSGGTGWIVDAERGHIVTNSHVVSEAATYSVETFDGDTGTAERVGYHRDLQPDVALLETDLDGLTELPTGDPAALETGDPLVTVGHPGSVGDWIVSLGRFQQFRKGMDLLLSTVPTDEGNSGGPLVTLDGTAVGVVSGSLSADDERLSKPDRVFTELPRVEGPTTATDAGTLRESIEEWT